MLNNQNDIYSKLINDIKPLHSDRIIMLVGKPGIGKSYVVERLKRDLQEQYSAPICYLKGDQFCQNRRYYCFKNALNSLTIDYNKKKEITNIASKGAQGIPYVGPVTEKLLINTLNHTEIAQKQRNYFLDNDEEQEIIFRLNYLLDKRASLIICDNVQYYDEKSLELLYLMMSSKEEIFDFLDQCQFLLVYTKIGEQMHPIIQKFYDERTTIKYEMTPVDFSEIDYILKQFDCQIELDTEIKKIIFKLSDGHLEVIKQIALQMGKASSTFDLGISSLDAEKVLDALLAQKLKNLGANGEQISQLLEYASLIGRTFSNSELSTIVELNSQEFRDAIMKSNEMALINSNSKYSNFSHDIIQLIFRNRADRNLCYYYERMRECIKELYPAEYEQRIEIEEYLGDTRQAAILIVLYCVKKNYDLDFENNNYNKILSLNSEIENFLEEMKNAFEAYKKRDYKKTISILNAMDDLLPNELLAERDILKSISLTKMLSEEYRQESITCLQEYTLENLNHEGDLYLRVLLSRISSFSHMAQIEQARKCEKEISCYLQKRVDYDDNAMMLINILRRKANSMHECIYAEKHIKKSVIYFAPLPNQNAPLNPIQYLMSLANYTGILIECARFAEACDEIAKAQQLLRDNKHLDFPRTHIVDNNYLLSVYLADGSTKEAVLKAYTQLVNLSQNADNIFIISNYCSLLAVNGQTIEAYQQLKALKNQLEKSSEPFYELCIDNNLLVLMLYYKEFDDAQKLLNTLSNHVNGVIDESYYRKKWEIFQHIIDRQIPIPLEKIDTFVFDYCESYQEAWNYWGRSFDYTALYFWSDM